MKVTAKCWKYKYVSDCKIIIWTEWIMCSKLIEGSQKGADGNNIPSQEFDSRIESAQTLDDPACHNLWAFLSASAFTMRVNPNTNALNSICFRDCVGQKC